MTDEERARQIVQLATTGRSFDQRMGVVLGELKAIRAEAMAEQRERDAEICERVNEDCNRESRHEPEMMRNGAGAAMCKLAIRAQD